MQGVHISAPQFVAASTVAKGVAEMFFDNAERFTCSEAEDIKEFLTLWNEDDPSIGDRFLDAHSYGDDEGDLHYRGGPDV